MQWNTGYTESLYSFANTINTHEGGMHEEGLKKALTNVLNRYARAKGLLKEKDDNLIGEDVREGLIAIISVKLHDPQFEGQTKTKLGNASMRSLVETTVNAAVRRRGSRSTRPTPSASSRRPRAPRRRGWPREQARDLTRRKSFLESGRCRASSPTASSPTRLAASSTSSRATRPAGRAKSARDRATQAILPIRGKILNVEKARLHKILENNEIQALITAIGTGHRRGVRPRRRPATTASC